MKSKILAIIDTSESEEDKIDKESSSSSDTDMCHCKISDAESDLSTSDNEDYYKILSQFQESDINVLTSDNILEFLKQITNPTLKSQIIDDLTNKDNSSQPSTSQTEPIQSITKVQNPYMMSEVHKLLKSRGMVETTPTTIKDLENEIEELKSEIAELKDTNVSFDNRLIQIEKGKQIKTVNIKEEETTFENPFKNEDFLSSLQLLTSQRWQSKIKLLINKEFEIEVIAMFDSGADISVIHERLIPTKYFEKTSHTLRHAGGQAKLFLFAKHDNFCIKYVVLDLSMTQYI